MVNRIYITNGEVVTIRTASNTDTEQITRLVKQGLREFGFTYDANSSEADLYDIEREYPLNGGIFLVALNSNQLVTASGGLIKLSPLKFKIRKMYVHKNYRGMGISKQILTELENYAIGCGGKQIVLETTKAMKAAISLYKSFGYKEKEAKIASPRCDLSMTKYL